MSPRPAAGRRLRLPALALALAAAVARRPASASAAGPRRGRLLAARRRHPAAPRPDLGRARRDVPPRRLGHRPGRQRLAAAHARGRRPARPRGPRPQRPPRAPDRRPADAAAARPFVERGDAPPGAQRHAPGWVSSMDSPSGADQHLVYDAEVVDGLVAAWRARRALDLPAATVAAIEDRIGRTVAGRFWRYPAIRLNQINWYGLMYARLGDRQRPRQPAAPRPRAADPALRARHPAATATPPATSGRARASTTSPQPR